MTTLAADSVRTYEAGIDRPVNELPVIASDIIYEGAAIGDNASGYMRPLVSGDPFRGFAERKVDNSAGAAGAKNVRLHQRGLILLAISGVALTDVGKPVWATDDDTFVITGGIGTKIGVIYRYVSSGYAIVYFDAIEPVEDVLFWTSPIVAMSGIADGDLVTTFTPGFAGRIKTAYWVQGTAVSTGSKASTLNLEIGTTNLTGGTIALTSAACTPRGKVISAATITAGAAFGATDTISIEAASTTTFVEGDGYIVVVLGR